MKLQARALVYARDSRVLLDDVGVELKPGEVLAVLGPNGAGKSTLLRLLAGELTPDQGQVQLNGRDLGQWSARERAQRRAVLPQTESLRFAFSVEQVLALGRTPCVARGAAHEQAVAHAAMQAAGIAHLAGRLYTHLSVGERARVQLARVLAQVWEPQDEPRYLLLDEPTASLDLAHQHEVLAATRAFAATGAGVLAVLHDPNLALAYADRCLLLREGRAVAIGPVDEVLTPERVGAVFGITVEALPRAGSGRAWLAAVPRM